MNEIEHLCILPASFEGATKRPSICFCPHFLSPRWEQCIVGFSSYLISARRCRVSLKIQRRQSLGNFCVLPRTFRLHLHWCSLQSNFRLGLPLVSDHLSSATTFSKYQKFSIQITIFGTSCKRPPLVNDHDHF